jgi:hypothetical protein
MAAHLRHEDQLPLAEPINMQELVKEMWRFRSLSLEAAKVMEDRELWESLDEERQADVSGSTLTVDPTKCS